MQFCDIQLVQRCNDTVRVLPILVVLVLGKAGPNTAQVTVDWRSQDGPPGAAYKFVRVEQSGLGVFAPAADFEIASYQETFDGGLRWESSDLGYCCFLPRTAQVWGSRILVGGRLTSSPFVGGLYLVGTSRGDLQELDRFDAEVLALSVVSDSMLILGLTDGVLSSNDAGRTWSSWGLVDTTVHALTTVGDTLFAGTDFGLHVRAASDISWRRRLLTESPVYDLAASGDTLVAATSLTTFISSDRGESWVGSTPPVSAKHVAVSGSYIVVAGDNRVSASEDGGSSWYVAGDVHGTIRDVDFQNSHAFIATELGVFRSNDHLGSLDLVGAASGFVLDVEAYEGGLIASVPGAIFRKAGGPEEFWRLALTSDELTGELTVLGTTVVVGSIGGVWVSADEGVSWNSHRLPDHNAIVYDLSSDSLSGFLAATSNGLMRSEGGETWTIVEGFSGVLTTAVTVIGQMIVVADPGRIFVSFDSGTSFQEQSDGLSSSVVDAIAANEKDRYVIQDDAVLAYDHLGNSWSALSPIVGSAPQSIGVDNAGLLFAGTISGGVYVMPEDGGWMHIEPGLPTQFGREIGVISISFDIDGALIVGTAGRGVLSTDQPVATAVPRPVLLPRSSITAYPNPVAGRLTIEVNGHASYSEVQVSDNLGRTVFEWILDKPPNGVTSFQIDATSYSPGVYWLTLGGHGEYISTPFVVVR